MSWPTIVLAAGVLLSLAANLAQAQPDAWGQVMAATPAGAFLTAISMLERRATTTSRNTSRDDPGPGSTSPPPPAPSENGAQGQDGIPALPSPAGPPSQDGAQVRDGVLPSPSPAGRPSRAMPAGLAGQAREAAADHLREHGRPITRDALRARLGVSTQLATDLLRHIREQE